MIGEDQIVGGGGGADFFQGDRTVFHALNRVAVAREGHASHLAQIDEIVCVNNPQGPTLGRGINSSGRGHERGDGSRLHTALGIARLVIRILVVGIRAGPGRESATELRVADGPLEPS